MRYLLTYGVLQGLFLQQDAVQHLSEALRIDCQFPGALEYIRSVRNTTIGHPTKHNQSIDRPSIGHPARHGAKIKTTSYNFIHINTLSKQGFKWEQWRDKSEFFDAGSEVPEADLYMMFREQLHFIKTHFDTIINTLREREKTRREKFKDAPLLKILHAIDLISCTPKISSAIDFIDQVREKGAVIFSSPDTLSGAISSPYQEDISWARKLLRSIQKIYKKYEDALRERGELGELQQHELGLYHHALSKLESYFEGDGSTFSAIREL